MLERALLVIAGVGVLVLATAAVRTLVAARTRGVLARLRATEAASAGGGRLVYFTTSSCVVCRYQQEPALEALLSDLPEVSLERHDAIEERELAERYGVLSVPTIAVYDRTGSLVTVNRGFTPASVLRAQLEGAKLYSRAASRRPAARVR